MTLFVAKSGACVCARGRIGGCRIYVAALSNHVCICKMNSYTTCSGVEVPCPAGKEKEPKCTAPDTTKESCLLSDSSDCRAYSVG